MWLFCFPAARRRHRSERPAAQRSDEPRPVREDHIPAHSQRPDGFLLSRAGGDRTNRPERAQSVFAGGVRPRREPRQQRVCKADAVGRSCGEVIAPTRDHTFGGSGGRRCLRGAWSAEGRPPVAHDRVRKLQAARRMTACHHTTLLFLIGRQEAFHRAVDAVTCGWVPVV
jgi:hypothetical protein